jgi:hypothetical protein
VTLPEFIDVAAPGPNRATTRVLSAVAHHFHLTPAALLSRDRHRTVSIARQVVMFVLREYQRPRPSYPEIARELGGRDHTTIMAGVKSANRQAVIDESVRDAIEMGKLALESLDQNHEVRRLAILAQRDRLVRKATELNEELAQLRAMGGGE